MKCVGQQGSQGGEHGGQGQCGLAPRVAEVVEIAEAERRVVVKVSETEGEKVPENQTRCVDRTTRRKDTFWCPALKCRWRRTAPVWRPKRPVYTLRRRRPVCPCGCPEASSDSLWLSQLRLLSFPWSWRTCRWLPDTCTTSAIASRNWRRIRGACSRNGNTRLTLDLPGS